LQTNKTFDQQPRAREQDQCEDDLDDDEPSAGAMSARAWLAPRGASFSDTARFERDARHAGNKPETIPTPTLAMAVTTRTRGSGEISSMRGMLGRIAFSESMPQIAITNPARPPSRPSNVLSASNCLIIRQRPAPSAARMLNSRLRESDRASNRFATFETGDKQHAAGHRTQHQQRRMCAANHCADSVE